jgi:uncharacterized protein (DUF362 family)
VVQVVLLKTENRREGVRRSLDALGVNPVKGKDVLIKPNLNTADPAPASTDNETLIALIERIWEMGAKSIRLGERSWLPTREALRQKGVLPFLSKWNVEVVDFDDLSEKDWIPFKPARTHWTSGFRVARPVVEAECLVSTCCLKTHQHGGVFTLSLKLHVGVVPTYRNGFEYMKELHHSRHQRKMIAEINAPFSPSLILLDGVDAFVTGGPASGKRVRTGLMLASTNRVALDAAGVAVLKSCGSTQAIMGTRIFEQEQIARAAELGLGPASASEVEIIAADEASRPDRDRVLKVLSEG